MANEFASRARARWPCTLACLLLLASPYAWSARAQDEQAAREPAARKVSEYVNQFTSCNAGAHLDLLAIELQNAPPSARAHVIVYGPGGPDERYADGEESVEKPHDF